MIYPPKELTEEWGLPTSEESLRKYTEALIEWTAEKIAQDFDLREQGGVRGYSPSLPAKLIRNLYRPTAPTLRQLYIRAVNEVASDGPNKTSSYAFLEQCLKGRFQGYSESLENLSKSGDYESLKAILELAPLE